MFHSDTSALIEAWNALPDAGRIPARADFDPMNFGPQVPRLWSADRSGDGLIPIRLAGSWVERLHGRPLSDIDWMSLWRPDSRQMVTTALTQTFREARPVVLMADSPLMEGGLEILLTPLRDDTGAANRIIGLYQPLMSSDRSAESVGELIAHLSMPTGINQRAPLTLAALDGRLIA